MSTKSKRRMARRSEARHEKGPESTRFSAEERVIVGELMGALLSMLTLGAIEE